MTTPGQLYQSYTENPCLDIVGAGSPYNLVELTQFLKQIKYPCLKNVPGYQDLAYDTNYDGSGKLALPYKYLEIFDPHLFSEIQPSMLAGPAHSIRNAADISRACDLVEQELVSNTLDNLVYHTKISKNTLAKWNGRGATEHMTFFGGNSITKCLFVLGPDLVSHEKAIGRGTGCDDMDCLPPYKNGQQISSLGAGFSCEEDDSGDKECTPCKKCPPEDDEDPCCQPLSCADRANTCCGDPSGDGQTFIYNVSKSNDTFFKSKSDRISEDPNNENVNIFHLGYLTRNKYGGYVNLEDCSDRLFTCPTDLFIKYVQENNGYNYPQNITSNPNSKIERCRTITYIDNVEDIKRLIYNGYGITLLSNIGFAREKDSYGVSYPDKIWYHSYAIVGYDDTKKHFDECVYVLANSWGNWNFGGNPPWGKLPTGCFLVTETHLRGMLTLERIDKIGCREKKERWLAADGERFGETIPACVLDDSCVPWTCNKKQRPMGMAFLMCFSDKLKKRHFDYKKMINVAENDYVFGQETNIFVKNLESEESTPIYFNNLSGTMTTAALSTPSHIPAQPKLVKSDKTFEPNPENKEPLTYILDSLLNYQTDTLNNFDLDFEINKTEQYRYINNEITNYNTLFNKNPALSDESKSLIGNNLTIDVENLYADNIYSNQLIANSVQKLAFNNLKADHAKITSCSIATCSKEIRQSIMDVNTIVIESSEFIDPCIINCKTYAAIKSSELPRYITINSPLIFLKQTTNDATLNGTCIFIDQSINQRKINGNAIFCDALPNVKLPFEDDSEGGTASENNGQIIGLSFFENSQHNSGTFSYIEGDCITNDTGNIKGLVVGDIIEQNSVFTRSKSSLTPR
jgi:hypothetical protein